MNYNEDVIEEERKKMLQICCIGKGLLNQYIAGFAASLSIVCNACCFCWITPILSHLQSPDSEIPMTTNQESWVISAIEIGSLLSPFPAGVSCNYFGRKPVLLMTGPLCIISWLMILYLPSPLMLGAARVVQGAAMGVALTVTPIYMGEIASDAARGAITSFVSTSWWFGTLLTYIVGAYLSFKNFTYFTLATNIPFMLLFIVQPESPHFYVLTGNKEKAFQSLKLLRDTSEDKLREELQEIELSASEEKNKGSVQDVVATAVDRKALAILLILASVRLFSGTGSIVVYAQEIFNSTPNLLISSNTIVIGLGLVMFVGSCVSSFTSDVFGRRPLLLISCVGSCICQFFTGTYYFLLLKYPSQAAQYSWLAPVSILLYSGLCTAGLYPVCSSYTSELFTSRTRGIASSIAAIIFTVDSFLMLITFQGITDLFGLHVNFYIYSFCTFLGTFYFYFFAPETKGKSFAQIRKDLS